jgi:Ca2+/Na+ antiporter
MKKLLFFSLVICFITIVYFFIREQFNKVVLTHNENLALSVTYLLVGIILLILFIIKNKEDKKKQ